MAPLLQNKQIVICVYDGCHVAFVLPVKCLTYYTFDGYYSTLLTFNQYSRHYRTVSHSCQIFLLNEQIKLIAFIYLDTTGQHIWFPWKKKQFSLNNCNIAVLCRLTNVNVRFCHLKSRIPWALWFSANPLWMSVCALKPEGITGQKKHEWDHKRRLHR